VHWVLRVISGPLEGEEFVIDGSAQIGRSGDIAVQLIGPSVSRHHAELRLEAGRLTLVDLGSRNGTFVDGERIERRVLVSGGTFEIGKSSFVVEERPGLPEPDDMKLNLLSGPVLDVTETFERSQLQMRALRATTAPEARPEGECADPLHALAQKNGWRFCPVCGASPVDQ
jgi:pSer/pThr/pTyr-binding forkhead associated (FHA) protein